MKPLIIIGCGGHAKSVADVVLYNEPDRNLIFLDDNACEGETILNFPVIKNYNITNEDVFAAVGDNNLRNEICKKYHNNLINILSNRAYVGKNVIMGKGIFIAHNAHIGILSKINNYAVINTNASIDHECTLGTASTVAPGAVLCGKVTIGNLTWIGANASVREKLNIADNITIGMGAVVVKDIYESGVYVGCPACLISKKE